MNIKTANRLCELRKQHGYSQEDLANKLGVSRQAVSKWERSESSPDTDNLIELAKLYGISLDELLNGDDALDIINENRESNNLDDESNESKHNIWQDIYNGIIITITVIIYLVLGFCLKNYNGWNYWFLFLYAIALMSVSDVIIKRKLSHFSFPVLITAIYCNLGIMCGLWHPMWVLFISIPIYYLICDVIERNKK